MRYFKYLLALIIITSCSETQLVEYWKNPEIDNYSPNKVLVVGLTSNEEAGLKFENKLKEALEIRGVETATSTDFNILSSSKDPLNENKLNSLEKTLIEKGFDAILFSKVVGVEDMITYKKDFDGYDETYRRFKEDFLRYQDAFYNEDYYNEYTVYHAETSMYCICPSKERELLWKGYIDITDPREVDKTINQYVNIVVSALEELSLIDPVEIITDKKEQENIL
ncbi:hypothetical protein [Winogradskyella sp. A2]|uniref:hypothetical protein n=1 Tax=Winogradskyella sp. A2 TaxID=3366944 RepID=UPI00398C7979